MHIKNNRTRFCIDNPKLSHLPQSETKLTLRKGQVLYRDEDAAAYLYEVVSGVLKLEKILPDGREQIVDIVSPGWLCGFSSNNHYTCSCVALAETVVLAHSRAALRVPGVEALTDLEQRLESQICAMHTHTLTMGQKTPEERVATFLMRFIPGYGAPNCSSKEPVGKSSTISIPISQKDIANYLGLSQETVSRIMSKLRYEGLVMREDSYRDLYISDICKLCRYGSMNCDPA